MCTARHDMVQIACGCAAHTVFVLTIAPQMFRCRGGSLSRAHSVGRPPCSPRQCVTTRELFFWMDVIFLQVALGSLPLVVAVGPYVAWAENNDMNGDQLCGRIRLRKRVNGRRLVGIFSEEGSSCGR